MVREYICSNQERVYQCLLIGLIINVPIGIVAKDGGNFSFRHDVVSGLPRAIQLLLQQRFLVFKLLQPVPGRYSKNTLFDGSQNVVQRLLGVLKLRFQ